MAIPGRRSWAAASAVGREAGVRIGFGTDLMGALDGEQLHGLRLQAEVEGPLALLRAATSVNAGYSDVTTWAGSVRARSPTCSSWTAIRCGIRPYCGAARIAGPCSRAASGW